MEADTCLCIETAIGELRYIPNLRARGLRKGKANTIVLFFSMLATASSWPAKLGFMMEVAMTAGLAVLEK